METEGNKVYSGIICAMKYIIKMSVIEYNQTTNNNIEP